MSNDGLCKVCSVNVGQDIARCVQIVRESMEIVEKTKNPDTMVSRLELAMKNTEALLEYEKKGIRVTNPLPSVLRAGLEKDLGRILRKMAEEQAQAALAKAALARSPKGAISAVAKALDRIQEMGGKLGDPPELDEIKAKLAGFIEKEQAHTLLPSKEGGLKTRGKRDHARTAGSRTKSDAVTENEDAYEEGSASLVRDIEAVGITMEKSWSTVGDDACEICRGNASAGWIPTDKVFPSGHMYPLAHDGCRCCLLYRVSER